MSSVRVVLTGGGTGGHIFPLLSVFQSINILTRNYPEAPNVEYFGPTSDYWPILQNYGIRTKHVSGSKLRRYFDVRNIIDVPKFLWSLVESFWKLFWFMPDVVFGKGGPGSLPVILAASFYRIPVLIHESDAIPSLTTRLTARFATRIAISFEITAKYLSDRINVIALTGNPVREAFLIQSADDSSKLKESIGLDPQKPAILFLGGSQGAEEINNFVANNLEILLQKFQVLHQTGITHYGSIFESTRERIEKIGKPANKYIVFDLADKNTGSGDELRKIIQASDLVISRAGSGAIFEIAAMGKPSILVPLGNSASDHQRANAYEYAKSGAAEVVEESNFLPHIIVAKVEMLLRNMDGMDKMRKAAEAFSRPEAANILAKEILKLGER